MPHFVSFSSSDSEISEKIENLNLNYSEKFAKSKHFAFKYLYCMSLIILQMAQKTN